MRNSFLLLMTTMLVAPVAFAATPGQLLEGYAQQASAEVDVYSGPSAAAGRAFFNAKHTDWSCASCHTADPSRPGKHAVTGKAISPLAPYANAERFRDPARVEKWFKRNCNDTLDRPCTAAEKSDVLAFLLTFRTGA
jgi:hypothetical protein